MRKILLATIFALFTFLAWQKLVSINVKAATTPTPVTKKVLVLDFDPVIQGSKTLSAYKGWSNPSTLQNQYISDVKLASHNYVNYSIVKTQVINGYPQKISGFKFTNSTYLGCLSNSSPSYCRELIDYKKLITDYNLCGQVNSGAIDEVWLWGGPYFGYYEAIMAGPNAYSTNAPPITGTTCTKSLHVMGFNYERGVSEMLENLGHRIEGTMNKVFGALAVNLNNEWNRFSIYDKQLAGKAGCGSIHYPFNGQTDYDWANTTYVNNRCDDWLNFPSTLGIYKSQNCSAWGCTAYGYKKYWLNHLPYKTGITNNKLNNWWQYVVGYDSTLTTPTNGEKRYQIEIGANDYYTSCGTTKSGLNEVYLGVDPACTTNNFETAYLVFPGVSIAKNAVITDAYVEFVADGTFTNVLNEAISVTDDKYTSAAVSWPINTTWTYYTLKTTPSLKSSMQSLVNSTGWISGATVKVKINHVSGTGQRRFFAFEREGNAGARLVVTVQSLVLEKITTF